MLNHRIRGLLFHYKKKLLFCNWLLFFGKSIQKHPIPSVRVTLTMSKMLVLIICQNEREVNYFTAKKNVNFNWLLFSSMSIQNILILSHSCSFWICRCSPCCKPVKPGHCSTASYFARSLDLIW